MIRNQLPDECDLLAGHVSTPVTPRGDHSSRMTETLSERKGKMMPAFFN
jgi:hypothetical protein